MSLWSVSYELVPWCSFPPSLLWHRNASDPLDSWDATIPTSISYHVSTEFLFFFFFCYPFFQYFQLFQLFFLCSFFPIHLQRPTCAADGPAAQPMDVGKTASAREHQLFFLLTEHPVFMTAQWRRVGECSQIKQKKFALVISMWESCPWLMVLQ